MKLLSVVCAAALAAVAVPGAAFQVVERGAWPDSAAHCLFGDVAGKQPLSAFSRRADGLGLRFGDEPVFVEGKWRKASAVANDSALRAKYQSAMEAEASELRAKLEPISKSFDGAALSEVLDEFKERTGADPGRVSANDPVVRDWLVRVEFLNELGRSVTFEDDCGGEAQARALEVARSKVAEQKECIVQGIHRSASLRPPAWVCDGATFTLN
jgi:hypothetical protein